MIDYLNGKLVDKSPTEAIIDVGGVGYKVNIPLSTFDRLGKKDSEVKILTYLYVRESIQQLYGFASAEEKNLFKLLISVSGIGPKLALAILSSLSSRELKSAILNERTGILTLIQFCIVPIISSLVVWRYNTRLPDINPGNFMSVYISDKSIIIIYLQKTGRNI